MSASIFVSIASYRDTEGPATLADLFARADVPERVFAGVFWQVSPGIDDDCTGIPPGVPRVQVRELHIDPALSLGVCWARNRIQCDLYRNEDWFLQIDSHMRFVQGWDTLLLEMVHRCPSARPVLSTYPAPYTPGGKLSNPMAPVLLARGFSDRAVLLQSTRHLDPRNPPRQPPPNAFCAAGFLFGPGSLVSEVPYDPHIYFHGEEITLAVRLWTHGYDLYSPDRHVMWHDYSGDRGRPRHWHDRRDWGALSARSAQRIRHLLGVERSRDPMVLQDIDRYGLGEQRSLEEYELYADLDFAKCHLGLRSRDGRFPPHPSRDPGSRERRRKFTAIFRSNAWGNASTRSGSGATETSTALLKPLLRNLLAELDVRVLADAGCGEYGWMRDVAEVVELYLGYDIVPELCERNLAMVAGEPRRLFACVDITSAVLPRADVILCRHCLTHLPDADVQQALARFRASGSRYLLATTYDQPDSHLTSACGWRKLDLAHPRFGLGRPLRHLVDLRGAGGCRLTLWRLERAAVSP